MTTTTTNKVLLAGLGVDNIGRTREDYLHTDLGVDRRGHLVQKENVVTTREAEPPMLTTAHHAVTGLTEMTMKLLITNKESHLVIQRMKAIQETRTHRRY